MNKHYKVQDTIRGEFYRIELTKGVKRMPWFAPEYIEVNVWTVTVKFRDEEPYFQMWDTSTGLLKEDIKEIYDLLARWFVETDFII